MVELRDSQGHFARGNAPWNKWLDNSPRETIFATTELVRRKAISGVLKVKLVPVGPRVISEGVVKLERVPAICPACGQQVEAVATDGRVKGYCTVAKQHVSFPIESQPGITAPRDSEVSSTSAEQRWQDPEFRAKMSAFTKKRWQNPEYRAKMRAAAKKLWQNPEYRAKMSTSRIGTHPTDETRAKISAAVTRWHNEKRG